MKRKLLTVLVLGFMLVTIPLIACADIDMYSQCSVNLEWKYDTQTATLTIRPCNSGTGTIPSYQPSSNIYPYWYNPNKINNQVTAIIIEEGITIIGNYAFDFSTPQLTSLYLPSTLTSIGNVSFSYLPAQCTIYYNGTAADWEAITKGASNDGLTTATIHYNNPQGTCGTKINWVLSDGVLSVSATANNAVMPAYSQSNPAPWHEYADSISSIVIDGTVRNISDYAFDSCTNIASVTFSTNNFTDIGTCAFRNCSGLNSVAFPSTIARIESNAFEGCSGLTSVTFPSSSVYLGEYVFTNCTGLTSIVLPSFSSSNSPSCSVPAGTFSGCSRLSHVTIPDGTKGVGSRAFYYCTGLSSIIVPDSVTSVGSGAFCGCTSLNKVYYSGTTPQWNNISIATDNNPFTNATRYSRSKSTLGSDINVSFYGDGLLYISGSGSITSDNKWQSRSDVKEIIIESGITGIDCVTFKNLSGLTRVSLPEGLTSIQNFCFSECSNLRSINIPASVLSIGQQVLSKCPTLSNLTVHPGNPNYTAEDNVLYNKNRTTLICCPAPVMNSENQFIVPGGVSAIGDYAFFDCMDLKNLVLQEGVETIGIYAIDYDPYLTSVTLPATLTSIGAHAFRNCSALTDIYYAGTPSQWRQITIGSDNSSLTGAAIHYINCTPGEPVRDKEVSATCTTAGSYEEVIYCTDCHEELSRTAKTIEAPGHNLSSHAAVTATCTTAGSSAYWSCSVCGKYFSDENGVNETEANSWVIPAAHQLSHVPAKDPSCTETGNIEYWYCGRCEKYFSDEAADTEITETETQIGKSTHTLTVTDAVAASCTDPGNSAYWTCSVCGKYFSDEYGENETEANSWIIPAAHQPSHVPAKAPSCTETGNIEYWYCISCEKYFSDETAGTEITEAETNIDKSAHTLAGTDAVAASCTDPGNSAYWTCSVCGKYFSDENGVNETEANSWVIPAAHQLSHVPAKDSSCTETGNIEYWYCNRCEKYFSDEGATCEITETQAKIQKLDHIPGLAVHENEEAATCRKAGSYDEVFCCSVCGQELSRETKTIAVLDHTPGDPVTEVKTEATCTTAGLCYDVVYCSVCGFEIRRTPVTIDPLGHVVVIDEAVAPTCTETGLSEWSHCSRCQAILLAPTVVEKLPHVAGEPQYENEEPATCHSSGGYDEVFYCTACGAEIKRTRVTIAAAHTYDNPEYTWSEDHLVCTATKTCTVCADADAQISMVSDHVVFSVVQSPTEEDPGTAMCRAVFDDDSITAYKEISIPALNNMNVLNLPAGVEFIEEEAFAGIDSEAVIIPESCREIGPNAFANCKNLRYVHIPKNVIRISDNAFDGSEKVILDIEQE